MRHRRVAARSLASLAALLALLAPPLRSQQTEPPNGARITGRVTSQEGAPIFGATVAVPSAGVGATTDADGRYQFTVPANRLGTQPVPLIARAIGYRPVSVELTLTAGTVTRDFALIANPLRLGEVVVTGAGTSSEVQKLTSVRNNVDSTLLQRSNEPNVVSALAAKAPNVEVTSSSGDPGASTYMRIRGTNTLTGTGQPLVVVDGVPVDNSTTNTESIDQSGYYLGGQGGTVAPNRASDINPADIESVEILKGAAAGAIYGARAGQGVILITTKHGRPGQTRYALNTSFSVDHVTHTPPYQMVYGQGDGGVADPCSAPDGPENCYAAVGAWGPKLAPGTPVYDHASDILQNGYTSNNNLSISGGNDRTTFFLSGEYLNQRGIFVGPNNDYKRSSVRLKATQRVGDRVTLGGNLAYAYTDGQFVQKGSNYGGIYTVSLRSVPDFNNAEYLDPVTRMHRSYQFPHPSAESQGMTRGLDNPFFDAYVPLNTAIANRLFGNVSIDAQLLDWLKASYTLGVDHSGDQRLEGIPQTSSDPPSPLGQVIRATLDRTQFDGNLVVTATHTFSPSLGGSIAVGQNLNSRDYHTVGNIGNELLAPLPYSIENTAQPAPPYDVQTRIRDEGYFGQATADLWDQLYLKGGVRYDGSSTFGTHQRNWFPSVSGAWEFTKLTGKVRDGVISYGKARLAYGEVGTEPDAYVTNLVYSSGTFVDPFSQTVLSARLGGLGGLFSTTTFPPLRLNPERTKELEGGVDLGLFKDRADLSVTLYRRTSSDVILPIPAAASTGYALTVANGAEIRNTGAEVSLNVRALARQDFGWEIGLQYGRNRNRVLSLQGAQFVPYGGFGGFGIVVAPLGGAVGSFQDVDFVRCGRGVVLDDGTGNPVDVDAVCGASAVKQHALYIGSDGFPVADPTKRIIGSPDPTWTGSVRNSVRWKKLNVSALVDIRRGGLVYDGTEGYMTYYGTSPQTLLRGQSVVFGQSYMRGPTAGPGAGTAVVLDQTWFQGNGQAYAVGAPWYEDGSYVKLREISVGYTFNEEWVHRLGMSSMDVRVAGRNLHTWTNYGGADPETSLSGADSGARGIDWFNNPQTRSVVFSLTLNR